jgi:hypothetical protein
MSAPSGTPAITRDGRAADDQFGNAVASAGDGNGDGLAEFLAGARFADVSAPGAGSATLHLLDCLDLAVEGDALTWGGCGEHASFDVRRGTAAGLTGGDLGSCLSSAIPGFVVQDPQAPDAGGIFTYLVLGRPSPPSSGASAGFGSGGLRRQTQPLCP